MYISIIIPTFNRCDTLLDCLDALKHQMLEGDCFEVIVVDDGSIDETSLKVAALTEEGQSTLRYAYQPNHGPAAARNLGASMAKGDLLLFLGDDIIATPDLIAHHVTCHHQNTEETTVVLGHTVWSPKLHVTPLMQWLDDSGTQFDYATLKHQQPSARHFYTSNISLKRDFFMRHEGFDEDFPYAAYEDFELGVRMEQDGMRIVYQPTALAYHDHPTSYESHRRRATAAGTAASILERKHPGLVQRPVQSRLSMLRRKILLTLGPIITMAGPEQMKLRLHLRQCDQLFWRAFDREVARGSEFSASSNSWGQ